MSPSTDRQDFRHTLRIPVRYCVAERQAGGSYRVSPFREALGDNFSGSGAAIMVEQALAVKTLVYLEMRFPFSGEPVAATGEVVRCERRSFRGEPADFAMVRFLLIDPLARDRLIGFSISRGTI